MLGRVGSPVSIHEVDYPLQYQNLQKAHSKGNVEARSLSSILCVLFKNSGTARDTVIITVFWFRFVKCSNKL